MNAKTTKDTKSSKANDKANDKKSDEATEYKPGKVKKISPMVKKTETSKSTKNTTKIIQGIKEENSLAGTETLKNLLQSHIGELQQASLYKIFAKIALNEGYRNISEYFYMIANQEEQQAKVLIRTVNVPYDEIYIKIDSHRPKTTEENLRFVIQGETHAHIQMYPKYIKTARKEGFPKIAELFRNLSEAEGHHLQQSQDFLQMLEHDIMFHSDTPVHWLCLNCGYNYHGYTAHECCPVCEHGQKHFTRIQKIAY